MTFTRSLSTVRLRLLVMTAVVRYLKMWGHVVWIALRYLNTKNKQEKNLRNFLENIKLLRTACPRFKPSHPKIYSYYCVHCNKHILHIVPQTTLQKCFCLCDNLYSLQHILSRLNLIGLVTEKANFTMIRELRAFLRRNTTTLLA